MSDIVLIDTPPVYPSHSYEASIARNSTWIIFRNDCWKTKQGLEKTEMWLQELKMLARIHRVEDTHSVINIYAA